jgi:hypothetical protein
MQAAANLLTTQHQRCGLKRLLDHCQLAFVHLEIKHLPRLGFLARQMSFHLSLELFLGQFLRFVQAGCTVELLSVPPRDLG